MYDAAYAQTLGHARCEFNLSPAEVAMAYDGCAERHILDIERRHAGLPDNYFEVLACVMSDVCRRAQS